MPFLVKGIFFALMTLLFLQETRAQFFDSIRYSVRHKPGLDFKIDSRNSFIASRLARIWGVKAGLDFNGTLKVGLGYNWLSNDIHRTFQVLNSRQEFETVRAQYHLQYVSPYAEYVFYRKRPWEISILVLVGVGRSHLSYFDSYWVHTRTDPEWVFLYEPYMTAEYRLWDYFGVGAGIGYRLSYSPDTFSRSRLNSPIYVFKVKFYLSDLYRAFAQK